MSDDREKVPILRGGPGAKEKLRSMVITDHAYLSAGDTPAASGDRAYAGCYHCGRPRQEHSS